MALKIYHNPRCSKSRATLAILEEAGKSPEIIHYLETPLNPDELKEILKKLGLAPRDIIRKGEAIYKELGLADETINDDQLIKAMSEHPILIERPIVINGKKGKLGRPPEAVLDIL